MDGPATLARIVEPRCIGCALCIAACPEDAILGARRFAHTVIAQRCTGCALCLPPCPVDCIELVPAAGTVRPSGVAARATPTRRPLPRSEPATGPVIGTPEHRRAAVQAALERARARRR